MNDESPDDPAERADENTQGGAVSNEAAPGNPPLVEAHSRCENALVMTPLPGLVLALLAGLAVWGALEMIGPVFQLPEHLSGLSNAPAAELQELRSTLKANQGKNAVFALVLLATTLALVLTVAELLFRRDFLRAVWGGLLAGLIAGVIALGAGTVAVSLHDVLGLHGAVEHQSSRLGKTMVVQGAMLGVMGLGIGIALGIPMFRPRLLVTCVTGCLLGGLLAALIFPIIAGVCMPHVNTELLVPLRGGGRLLWVGLATGLIGLSVSGLGKAKKKTRAAATPVASDA